jgi:hypothetical protein
MLASLTEDRGSQFMCSGNVSHTLEPGSVHGVGSQAKKHGLFFFCSAQIGRVLSC